jgi:cation diffusion facilitator family transporter
MTTSNDIRAQKGIRSTLVGIAANLFLGIVKGAAGVLGNSYALVADAIESFSDILTSIVVIIGLKISRKPADESHPYGHGKVEPIAAAFVSLCLLIAAAVIAFESFKQIKTLVQTKQMFQTCLVCEPAMKSNLIKVFLLPSPKQYTVIWWLFISDKVSF